MKKRAVDPTLGPERLAQDWSALSKGDRVQVLRQSGEKFAGVVDAVDAHRTIVWIAADGSRPRTLHHHKDSDVITKILPAWN